MPKGPFIVKETTDLLGSTWYAVVDSDQDDKLVTLCSDRDRAYTHRRRLNYEHQRTRDQSPIPAT